MKPLKRISRMTSAVGCTLIASVVGVHAQETQQDGTKKADNISGTSYFSIDGGVAFGPEIEIDEVLGTSVSGSDVEFTTDTGFRVDLVAGYNFSRAVALELEAGFIYNTINDLEVMGASASSAGVGIDGNYMQIPMLANLILHLPLDSKFKPYIGAGAGAVYGRAEVDANLPAYGLSGSWDEDSFAFGFGARAGVDFEISKGTDIGVGYKLLGSLEQDFDDIKTGTILTHSIVAALTLRF